MKGKKKKEKKLTYLKHVPKVKTTFLTQCRKVCIIAKGPIILEFFSSLPKKMSNFQYNLSIKN
jgi:hypothetical protein